MADPVLLPIERPVILGTRACPVAYPPADRMTEEVWNAMPEEEQLRYRVHLTVESWSRPVEFARPAGG